MEKNPLVSLCIITYNSSKTIIDTLESIKAQNYSNIELIISDDCSKDETVAIINKWISENGSLFNRTKIITSQYNTGVSANLNRVIREANGVWVKALAGDDLFLPNCIENNVRYVSIHPDILVLFSNEYRLNELNGNLSLYEMRGEDREFFNLSATEQYERLISASENLIKVAPSCFIRRDILIEYPFDERIRNLEDWPKWLDLTAHGINLSFMDEPTVVYRLSDSLTNSSTERFVNPVYFDSLIPFYYLILKPEYEKRGYNRLIELREKEIARQYILRYTFGNHKTSINVHYVYRLCKLLKINGMVE